jgi:hypothetical protein
MLAVERESLSSILLKKYPEWIAHETIGKYTSQQVLFLKKILLEEEKLFSYVSALYNTSTIEKEVCFYLIKNLLEGLPRYQGSIFADWLAIIFNTDRTEEFREKMLSMTVEFNISLVKQASIAFIEKLCGKAVQEGEFTELLRNQLLLIVSQYGASLGLKKEFSDLCNFYLEKIASCHNNASTVKSILKILLNISAIIKLFYLENAERENTFIGCLLGVIQLDDAEILQVSSSILKQVAFNEAQRNAIIQKLGQSYESYWIKRQNR